MTGNTFEVQVIFKPVGISLREASEQRRISFETNSTGKDALVNCARQEVLDRGLIDSYALEEHWEVGRIQVVEPS